jgi:hypothetical protein
MHSTNISKLPIEKAFSRLITYKEFDFIKHGYSFIPVGDDKRPKIPEWKKYQSKLPTPFEQHSFKLKSNRYGLITGNVSGNLLAIDFDVKNTKNKDLVKEYIEELEDNCPGLAKSLTWLKSKSGFHVVFRCTGPAGNNRVLAKSSTGKAIIETRGEGGYIVLWNIPIRNSLCDIKVVRPDELDLILTVAGNFNDYKPLDYKSITIPQPKYNNAATGILKPGDDYNLNGDIVGDLIKAGWSFAGEVGPRIRLRRPGKSEGWSATYHKDMRLLYIFSTSTNMQSGKGYKPFTALALLKFNGNFSDAARELRQLNYGN